MEVDSVLGEAAFESCMKKMAVRGTSRMSRMVSSTIFQIEAMYR